MVGCLDRHGERLGGGGGGQWEADRQTGTLFHSPFTSWVFSSSPFPKRTGVLSLFHSGMAISVAVAVCGVAVAFIIHCLNVLFLVVVGSGEGVWTLHAVVWWMVVVVGGWTGQEKTTERRRQAFPLPTFSAFPPLPPDLVLTILPHPTYPHPHDWTGWIEIEQDIHWMEFVDVDRHGEWIGFVWVGGWVLGKMGRFCVGRQTSSAACWDSSLLLWAGMVMDSWVRPPCLPPLLGPPPSPTPPSPLPVWGLSIFQVDRWRAWR